jgi:hypothetical protein
MHGLDDDEWEDDDLESGRPSRRDARLVCGLRSRKSLVDGLRAVRDSVRDPAPNSERFRRRRTMGKDESLADGLRTARNFLRDARRRD